MMKKGKHLAYNWFYEDDPIQRLIGLKKAGNLKLHYRTLFSLLI
jgi:hypothetical protein